MSNVDDATIFSQSRRITFKKPVSKSALEETLKEFLVTIGKPLSHNGVIVGHIKVLAKLVNEEEFLFLSLTRLDQVDVKPSAEWSCGDSPEINETFLKINVLVFGHSMRTVADIVNESLETVRGCGQSR